MVLKLKLSTTMDPFLHSPEAFFCFWKLFVRGGQSDSKSEELVGLISTHSYGGLIWTHSYEGLKSTFLSEVDITSIGGGFI